MNNELDILFKQARDSEAELSAQPFLAGLQNQLAVESNRDADTSKTSKRKSINYDWLLIAAVVLATLFVFFFTPAAFWLAAIPHLEWNIVSLAVAGASMTGLALASFAMLDWELV